MGRGDGPRDLRWWVAPTVLAVLVGAVLGGLLALRMARSVVAARGSGSGDGIGYVIPVLLGAAGAALLVLGVAAALLAVSGGRSRCVRVARWVVVVPIGAVLPFLVLLSVGSTRALVLATLPVVITGVAAGAVWRSTRAGIGVLGLLMIGGLTTVAVLGLDAVFLLLPHLLIGFGCWSITIGLLATSTHDRQSPPASRHV